MWYIIEPEFTIVKEWEEICGDDDFNRRLDNDEKENYTKLIDEGKTLINRRELIETNS